MSRYVYFALGWISVALGVIGAFLPLMPTTIFLIIAAWCFARSSPRFEAWLLDHPRFGPMLRSWRESGSISRRSKVAACLSMAFGFILFFVAVHPGIELSIGVGIVLAACAIFVASRPESGRRHDTPGAS